MLSTELPDSAECGSCGQYARISAIGTECTGDLVCVHCAQLMEWEQMPEAEYLLTECDQCMDRGCAACTLPPVMCNPTVAPAAAHRDTELFARVCAELARARHSRYVIDCGTTGAILATDGPIWSTDVVLFDSEAE